VIVAENADIQEAWATLREESRITSTESSLNGVAAKAETAPDRPRLLDQGN
jgi:hypothetical protein